MMENDDNIARKSPSSDQDKTIDDVSCSSLADDNLMEDTDDVVCQSKESAAQQDEAANLERSHGSNDESAITSDIEEDALCDKEKSSPSTTLGKRSRSNSDDLQEEQHQQQQVHLTQQDNAGGRTNTDNYFGLDPAEWNMRTIKANLVAPVGMYLTKQGDVIRVQIDTQADQLGIKVSIIVCPTRFTNWINPVLPFVSAKCCLVAHVYVFSFLPASLFIFFHFFLGEKQTHLGRWRALFPGCSQCQAGWQGFNLGICRAPALSNVHCP
jgi:hypothetical protein